MNGASATSLPGIALLMFAAGVGIPVLAALNANLGQQIGSPVAAGTILFAAGLVITSIALAIAGVPPRAAFAGVPPYLYGVAVFMVFYILSITWSAPRIGLGNAIFFVLLGQMVAAAAIDHFGLFHAIPSALTGRRAAGLMVMAFGVYLARKPR